MLRLAYLATHPIQYQAPLLRLIAASGEIDLKVFFLSDFSLRPHHEAAFGQELRWDVDLTGGYEWEVLTSWGYEFGDSLSWWHAVRDLSRKLKQGKFNALWIHGWGYVAMWQAVFAANQLGIPVLLRGESTPIRQPTGLVDGLKAGLREKIYQFLFRRVSACLYIGTLNRHFYEQCGVPSTRLFPMPYAVDNQSFRLGSLSAGERMQHLRRELNLPEGRMVVLFAAKFIEVKAPLDLISAWCHLLKEWPGDDLRPCLVLVGDGPLREKMQAAAESVKEDVLFAGFRNQSEMPAFYALCNLFVLPSRFEPWGLVINEVMNAARPVIASDCVGASRDLIEEGVNGWTFQSGNIQQLVNVLRMAFKTDLASMGQASLRKINHWGFDEDLIGLRAALAGVTNMGMDGSDL